MYICICAFVMLANQSENIHTHTHTSTCIEILNRKRLKNWQSMYGNLKGNKTSKTNLKKKIYKTTAYLLCHTMANPMLCAWTDFDSSSDALSVMQSLTHTHTYNTA